MDQKAPAAAKAASRRVKKAIIGFTLQTQETLNEDSKSDFHPKFNSVKGHTEIVFTFYQNEVAFNSFLEPFQSGWRSLLLPQKTGSFVVNKTAKL